MEFEVIAPLCCPRSGYGVVTFPTTSPISETMAAAFTELIAKLRFDIVAKPVVEDDCISKPQYWPAGIWNAWFVAFIGTNLRPVKTLNKAAVLAPPAVEVVSDV